MGLRLPEVAILVFLSTEVQVQCLEKILEMIVPLQSHLRLTDKEFRGLVLLCFLYSVLHESATLTVIAFLFSS